MKPVWELYKKDFIEKIQNPRFFESLTPMEDTLFLRGLVGSKEEGSIFCLSLIFDEKKQRVEKVSYAVFGPSILIGLGEVLASEIAGKRFVELGTIVRETLSKKCFIETTNEMEEYLTKVFTAFKRILVQLQLPYDVEKKPPAAHSEWESLSKEEKIALVDEVLEKEIRPYVSADQGGVRVLDVEGNEVTIAYEGACLTCHAATGSTLYSIQNILETFIYPEIVVVAHFDSDRERI